MRIFLPSTSSCSPPPSEIGVAEPMFVSGAIAATSAASVMYAPAEPARAPFGDTYTTTGIGAARMSFTMSRVESSRPPGVSRRKTTISAPSFSASSSACSTHPAEAGLIVMSSSTDRTSGPPSC